jgi:hypothetical protein
MAHAAMAMDHSWITISTEHRAGVVQRSYESIAARLMVTQRGFVTGDAWLPMSIAPSVATFYRAGRPCLGDQRPRNVQRIEGSRGQTLAIDDA